MMMILQFQYQHYTWILLCSSLYLKLHSEIQGYRDTGIQEYKNTGIQ